MSSVETETSAAPSLVDISETVDQAAYSSLRDEAETLRAKAESLRQEIEQEQRGNVCSGTGTETGETDIAATTASTITIAPTIVTSPWSLVQTEEQEDGQEYRLYVDVGREEGTWMDARWGASGKRIPFNLDIKLLSNKLADPLLADKMVKDNSMGKSSQVYALETAPFARLRDGFDRMSCYGGAYRIDVDKGGRHTIRIMVEVEGTLADQDYIYGDVSIPKGCLYFSLPCFGMRIDQLSVKEGPVTVRQSGWHTGWRRQESRMLGIFQAKTMSDAKRRDSY
ncbi:MAG: hypothetical protein SGILL_000205 [Bacillariaceae sp.]